MADGASDPPLLSLKEGALPEGALPDLLRDKIHGFFHDRTICHAVKPSFAVLVPSAFDAADLQHRHELGQCLAVAAQLLPGYRFDVLAAADLGPVLAGARQLRAGRLGQDLASYAFALSILDRRLAKDAAAHVPVRLVGSDPAPWFPDKLRLTFWDPRADAEAPAGERVRPAVLRGGPVLLCPDPFAPAAVVLPLLGRLRDEGVEPTLLLQPEGRAPLRAGLAADGYRVITEPPAAPPPGQVVCATDRFLLSFFGAWPLRVLVHATGELEAVAPPAAPPWLERTRHVLYRGEELDPLRVLGRVLGPGGALAEAAAAPLRHLRQPLISIVIPVYDRTSEIERLADAISQQAYPHLEIVFVSNGSPPATQAALERAKARLTHRRMKVRLFRYPEPFGCATVPRDIGAFAARGEFLCFIDSDDWFEPGFFDDFLTGVVDEEAIYYPQKIFRDGGRRMEPGFPFGERLRGEGTIERGLYELLRDKGNIFCNSGTMISKKHFLRAGGIWHRLRYAEDYDLWMRIARGGARAIEHGGAVSITLHPGNNELQVGDPRWVELARQQTSRVIQ